MLPEDERRVANVDQIPHRQLVLAKTGELLSRSALLTEFLCCRDLFVHHEVLAPGRRASAPHYHTEREEICYVLEGTPTVHMGACAMQLKAGDFVGFTPDLKEPHYIENRSCEEVKLLVICSNPESDRTVFS